MKRNNAIVFAILVVGIGVVLFFALWDRSDAGQQMTPTAVLSPTPPAVKRNVFTMNQLYAEGRAKAGIAEEADKLEAPKTTSSAGLDDTVADVLDTDPQLCKFYELRRKAVRMSAEQQNYLTMISDPKMIADARKDLLEGASSADVDQGEEIKRLQ